MRTAKRTLSILALLWALAVAWADAARAENSPPDLNWVVPRRAIADAGEQVALREGELPFTLFLPNGWTNGVTTNAALCLHFHTNPATTIGEHLRRGSRDPLAVFVLGSGSSAYRKPFEETNRFGRIVTLIEHELSGRRGSAVRVTRVDISSFSAGYGAVRELLKQPDAFAMARRVVLLDSMYASLESPTNRTPLPEHIGVWEPLARAAIDREKTFVISTSEVPTPSYASTRECAEALLKRLKMKLGPVAERGSTNVTLLARADSGNFHVWCYSGTNAPAHMAHVLHMADLWKASEAP